MEEVPEKSSPLIRIENLCLNIGGKALLKSVSLDVRKGHLTAILGANGAGKTTLLKSLLGIIKPQSGVIEIHRIKSRFYGN